MQYRHALMMKSLLFIPGCLSHITPFRPKSNTKCFSAKYNGPNVWKLIPANIQEAPNIFLFKRLLRKHLTGGSVGQ